MSKQLPLVVVLGATACGKSKLAIDLARRFGGEIISADSMQVYHGLDIVTNKVSEDEQALARHHVINFLDPMQRYSAFDFRNKSLNIIDNLFKKGSLPIVVGGTNYYIESIIWENFLANQSETSNKRKLSDEKPGSAQEVSPKDSECTLIDSENKLLNSLPKEQLHSDEDLNDVETFFKKPIYHSSFRDANNEKLWNILEHVDPESAYVIHPNDKRRVIRSLQIIQEKRSKYSEFLKNVNKSSQEGKASLGGPLRFKPTCVLWLNCENNILEQVLDQRVDQMLDRGLLAELENFHASHNLQRLKNNEKPDYTKGIFQAIGFKEFHNYLMLDQEFKESEAGNNELRKSIDKMKLSTRKYAKEQLKWIRKRFLQSNTRDLPPVYKLTTSFDEDGWQEQVREPAFEIVESLIENRPLKGDLNKFLQEPEKLNDPFNPGKLYCEACSRTFIGSHHIEKHLNSGTHKRNVGRLKKQKAVSNKCSEEHS